MEMTDLTKNPEEIPEGSWAPYGKMWADMKGDQLYFIIAAFAAAYLGSLNPMIGYMLSEAIVTLFHLRHGVSGAPDDLSVDFI
jgi:hypothetical protein